MLLVTIERHVYIDSGNSKITIHYIILIYNFVGKLPLPVFIFYIYIFIWMRMK